MEEQTTTNDETKSAIEHVGITRTCVIKEEEEEEAADDCAFETKPPPNLSHVETDIEESPPFEDDAIFDGAQFVAEGGTTTSIPAASLPPLPISVELLTEASSFWDLYDILWGEMSYLVTKRIQLLDAFKEGRIFIAKFQGGSEEMLNDVGNGAARPGSLYLKAFLVKAREDPCALESIFVVERLRRRKIGSQLVEKCGITRSLVCPTDCKAFLLANDIDVGESFLIDEERLFRDLLRMAIGFNAKTVRLLEGKLNAEQPMEVLVAIEEHRRRKRNALEALRKQANEDAISPSGPTPIEIKNEPEAEASASVKKTKLTPKTESPKPKAKAKAKAKSKAGGLSASSGSSPTKKLKKSVNGVGGLDTPNAAAAVEHNESGDM
eukprot:GHVH01006713.1.p1 GENE.GHVH01006713.1~~GHVH01006713.1.p1  ORF type:complete len:380 (+),score=65.49 GHVH01006713.1:85-1224(+)